MPAGTGAATISAPVAAAGVTLSSKIYRDNRQAHHGSGWWYGFLFINERSGGTTCYINDAYFAHNSSEDINVDKLFEIGAPSYGTLNVVFPEGGIRYENGLRMGWYSAPCRVYLYYKVDTDA